jgi:16S rRNA (guanine527-N7)-methyltransferase
MIEALTGRPADPTGMAQFRQYLALLLSWNRIHRLTGCQTADAMVRQLFVDSMLFLTRLPPGPLAMVDIGTGPGIPGVPLRIVRPELSLTLIESRRKSVSFLASLKRELDIGDLAILEGRAEEIVLERPEFNEAFDVVVTRAVGMRVWPTAIRYLKAGGLFVAGAPPAPCGGGDITLGGRVQARRETVSLRGLGESRTFVVGRKPA